MKKKIVTQILLLGGVMGLLLSTFTTAQSVPGSEVNVDNLHTHITAIEVSIPDQNHYHNNESGSFLFKLELSYTLWNAGRKMASFTEGKWLPLRDIIPLTNTRNILHSGEVESRRALFIDAGASITTYEFSPGITNDTAWIYLTVLNWTSDTLPLGNYTFHVGRATWQERLPATLHVESDNSWTEIADLPEDWGVIKTISGYHSWILGIGVVSFVGLWEWTRKRANSCKI